MNKKKTVFLAEVAIMAAVILLMAFTPIGYLKVGVIEITFLTLPVVVGAIVVGPAAGAVLGGIFGLTSFFQCFGMSLFGTTLFGINPFFTFLTCMIPRILMGWLCGLIFRAFRTKSIVSFGAAALSGALLNTIFFVLFVVLLFGNSDYIREIQGGANIFMFFVGFVGINGLVEAITCAVLGTAVSRAVYALNSKKIS